MGEHGLVQRAVSRLCGFRATEEFETAPEELIGQARNDRIALMLADAIPWRCHRPLIADALLARGIVTEHIMRLHRRQCAA